MEFNYADWVQGTYQQYNDPRECIGDVPKCKLCDKGAEPFDEYCENHQRCIMCGDNDDCGCEEEWSKKSNCCEAKMDVFSRCTKCGEHTISAWKHDNDMINSGSRKTRIE